MDKIGSGSYGKIYTDGDIAIKKFKSKDDLLLNAIREMMILRECDHPNIIKMIDIDMDLIGYTMEMFTFDLRRYLDNQTVLMMTNVYKILHDLVDATNYLHMKGIIHCDICPKNILVRMQNDAVTHAVLCDPGIALLDSETAHATGVQTYPYRAPEVDYSLDVQPFSFHIDVWSIGCMFYELICNSTFNKEVSDDTTIWVSRVLNTRGRNRSVRLNRLSKVTFARMRAGLLKAISSEPNAVKNIPDDYIDVMTWCLMPNSDRISSAELVDKYNLLFNKSIHNKVTPLRFGPYDTDDIFCITNVNTNIIAKMPHWCIQLAEHIYRKCSSAPTYTTQLACLYMSTAVYSSVDILDELEEVIDLESLHDEVRRIMTVTGGRLLSRL